MTLLDLAARLQQTAPSAPTGPDLGDALHSLAGVSIVAGLVGLVLVEFVARERLTMSTYRWLLVFGLAVAPGFALVGTVGTVFEEMKEVDACNSCHVLNPFVDDMRDPSSATLAARHFRSGAIPTQQCYACHSGYGVFGTLSAKRDGLRHWILYVTNSWSEPITYEGAYPNANCLVCHAMAPEFRDVVSHAVLDESLEQDQINCFSCHGLPHPSRPERTRANAEAGR